MNREIKFRGKTIDGLWEYGSLWIDKGKYYINGTDNNCWEVIPETVGEFTGLYDKNGKEIYEGDIVLCDFQINPSDTIKVETHIIYDIRSIPEMFGSNRTNHRVTDNIYHNKELLEGKMHE